MKVKTKYVLFYLAGLVEWGVIFYFLRIFHVRSNRLWAAFLIIVGLSGAASMAMYATRRIADSTVQLRYRAYITVASFLLAGACLWWAVVLSNGSPPLSLDVAGVAGAVMFAGVTWLVYRMMLNSKAPPTGGPH